MTKRPGMSDADRALAGAPRRRTPGHGYPVEIDPELTPPPSEIPQPSSLDGYDAIPAPIAHQLDVLADGLGAVTQALGKVWDARKDGERLDRLDSKLGTLAEYATRHETMLNDVVWPAVKDGMASHEEVARHLPRILAQLEQVDRTLQAFDIRLRSLEMEMRTSAHRWESTHAALTIRVDAGEARGNNHEIRIAQIERDKRDADVTQKALARKERRKAGGLAGIIAAVVAAATAVINHFVK